MGAGLFYHGGIMGESKRQEHRPAPKRRGSRYARLWHSPMPPGAVFKMYDGTVYQAQTDGSIRVKGVSIP